ncbi:MAG: ACP S-malonyltransferase [Chloroflexi bacterium]|nr:ACP S-malonyltransferase [Chloroflexota bacterium]
MAAVAYVFPGQGSQAVGMGKDLVEQFAAARRVFEEADATLGFSLSRLCFEGPADELRRTVNAQPAILVTSLACLRAAEEMAPEALEGPPSFVAGHSLGEYTALIAAGVVDFAQGLLLVRERGRLMEMCGELEPGTMAAILGLEEPAVEEICQEAGVEMANINCPGQIAVSGTPDGVARAMDLAKQRGARRAVPLDVSGAFHSRLMRPASEGLAKAVAGETFRPAEVPVVANVTGLPLTAAAALKDELVQQLTSPVRWQRSVEYMLEAGVTSFVEIGPGRVLTGLIRRIHEGARLVNIENAASLLER